MKAAWRSLITSILIYLTAVHCAHSQSCAVKSPSERVESIVATAASWDNFRKNPGSIRFESLRMLKVASTKAALGGTIIFRSIPRVFVNSGSEAERCGQLFRQTSATPLLYPDRRFATIEDFSNWFADFSQGSGTDGADLYQRCDGACSPQYTSHIVAEPTGFLVSTSVVCGTPRDKNDNSYILSTELHTSCPGMKLP